jgi:hypothetical protein
METETGLVMRILSVSAIVDVGPAAPNRTTRRVTVNAQE